MLGGVKGFALTRQLQGKDENQNSFFFTFFDLTTVSVSSQNGYSDI